MNRLSIIIVRIISLNGICDTIEQFGKQSYSASKKLLQKMITLVSMLEKVFLLNDDISNDNRYNYKALGIQIIYEIESGFESNGVTFFFHNCNIHFFQ